MKKVLFFLLSTCLVYCNKKHDDNPAPPEEEKPVYLSQSTAFFATNTNLYAIDVAADTLIWKKPVSTYNWNEIHTTPTYSNGVVFLEQGSFDNQYLTAYDAAAGTLKWSTFNEGGWNPTVKNGNVYISNDWDDDYSFDKNTGTINWVLRGNRRSIVDAISCSPAVRDSMAYVGGRGGIAAVNAFTGALKWSYGENLMRPTSCPVVMNGIVYFRTEDGLLAVNASDGKQKWKLPFNAWHTYSGLIIANGVLYTNSGSQLNAVDTATGKVNWSYDPVEVGAPLATPVILNNFVIINVGSSNDYPSYIMAIDVNTGQQVWKYEGKHTYFKSATVYNGNLYIGNQDGMQVFDAATGTLKWTFPIASNEIINTGICIVDTKNHLFTVSNSGDYENK
jgi:outer membrane protein assembly factor BamB